MFIVKKKIGSEEYFYLRESKRVGSKVKAVTLAYLGKDKKEAERKAENIKEGVGKALKGSTSDKKARIKMEQTQLEKVNLGIDELAMFCKRKGFVYPSGEIYGGLAGFWDFGPLGVEMLNNLKREWWREHIQKRSDIVGIDGSIITNPKVWKASGHVDSFVDYEVVNKKTKEKFKVDKHEVSKYEKDNDFEVKGEFSPMFTTQVGPSKEEGVTAYLRPETAQLIFADFKAVQENSRLKLPFGIAQVGKAFRNEISPREFLFRCREFEQMEIEYFIAPKQKCEFIDEIKDVEILVYSEEIQKSGKEAVKMHVYKAWKSGVFKRDWHAYWLAKEFMWFVSLGADPNKFRARQHLSEERSHYSSDTWDLEYEFPMGFRELEGFADRSTYDLSQHEKFSNEKLSINDPVFGRVLPEVVCEPSLGVGRAFSVFMLSSYHVDKARDNIVLTLNPRLAPIKAAVFPIVKGEEYEKISQEIVKELREEWSVNYDISGSIGRRYSRNDEIGTPMCITIDEETLKDKSVTIRERDTTEQVRVKISELREVLNRVINKGESVLKLGKLVETRKK